jgi:hypothetical protein
MTNTNTKPQNPQTANVKSLYKSEFNHQAEFPIECLGKTLSNATKSLVRAVNIPASMAVNSTLSAASTCAQAKIIFSLKHLSMPPSLFIITSSGSGDRKSAAYALAMKPILDFEESLTKKYKILKKQLKQEKSEETDVKQPHIIFDNASVEGIYKRFIESQPYQSLASPEGAALLGSHAMKESHMKLIISLSKLWSGEKLHWVTAGGGTIEIPNSSRLSMHLMIQPSLFTDNILTNKTFKEQGFLSRVLFSEPTSLMGGRIETVDDFNDFDIYEDIHYLNYLDRLKALLKDGFSLNPKDLNNFKTISMNRDSLEPWIDYKNEIEKECTDYGKYSLIKGIAAKSAEQAIRIASVITYIEHGQELDKIPPTIMIDGITIARWFLEEANRLFHKETIPDQIKNARTLLKWIASKELSLITARDLSSKTPLMLRKRDQYMPVIELLEKHGYLTSENGVSHQGQKLKTIWHVVTTSEP